MIAYWFHDCELVYDCELVSLIKESCPCEQLNMIELSALD